MRFCTGSITSPASLTIISESFENSATAPSNWALAKSLWTCISSFGVLALVIALATAEASSKLFFETSVMWVAMASMPAVAALADAISASTLPRAMSVISSSDFIDCSTASFDLAVICSIAALPWFIAASAPVFSWATVALTVSVIFSGVSKAVAMVNSFLAGRTKGRIDAVARIGLRGRGLVVWGAGFATGALGVTDVLAGLATGFFAAAFLATGFFAAGLAVTAGVGGNNRLCRSDRLWLPPALFRPWSRRPWLPPARLPPAVLPLPPCPRPAR